MKFFQNLLLLSVITVLSLSGAGAATASPAENTLTPDQITALEKRFDELGVKEEKRSLLLEKIAKGELLDSENPKMEDKGIVTHSENFNTFSKTQEKIVKTEYPDGSITINAITGGTATCGSGYCNFKKVKISGGNTFIQVYYYVDYTKVDQGLDYIADAYDENLQATLGASYSDEKLTIVRAKETLRDPAKVSLKWNFSGGGLKTTQYLHFYLGDDKESDEFVR
ncbi:hypothetical protein [Paenibacillus macerans]|uniref:hypothetical protein n=1 Tax=Paenibacillus macerans TaxID=44252 RepID=UPI00203EE38E|nr:hypothetical protein [Paenibacillus macerans]MCM3702053.1 hypothetical protein [Paenibacillus macerans]